MLNVDDVAGAVAEMRRTAELGLVGAIISMRPTGPTYDHPDYEPLWAAAQELSMPLSLHVGTARWRRESQTAMDRLVEQTTREAYPRQRHRRHALLRRLRALPGPPGGHRRVRRGLGALLPRPHGPPVHGAGHHVRHPALQVRRLSPARSSEATSSSASRRTRWAFSSATTSASTTSCGAPTTPTRRAPSPAPARSSRRSSQASPRRSRPRSPAKTPPASTASSSQPGSRPDPPLLSRISWLSVALDDLPQADSMRSGEVASGLRGESGAASDQLPHCPFSSKSSDPVDRKSEGKLHLRKPLGRVGGRGPTGVVLRVAAWETTDARGPELSCLGRRASRVNESGRDEPLGPTHHTRESIRNAGLWAHSMVTRTGNSHSPPCLSGEGTAQPPTPGGWVGPSPGSPAAHPEPVEVRRR